MSRRAGARIEAAIVAKADIPGIFIATHPWRTKPFVEPGQSVEAGAIVGLVRVGRLYVPVLSPAAGIVDAIVAGGRRDRRLRHTDRQLSQRRLTQNYENNPMHRTGNTAPSGK